MSAATNKRHEARLMKLLAQCNAWNDKYPVGTQVMLTRDNGTREPWTTRSKACVLSEHSAVIWLKGMAGCYLLDRCEPGGAEHGK
jgi:hypothetical protein